QPVERRPGVVTTDARAVGAGADRDAHLQHRADRRRVAGGLLAVAFHEILTGEGHAVLNGDAAAHGLDPAQLFVPHRLGVVDRPARDETALLTLDLFEDVHNDLDALAIRGVLTERPVVLHQDRRDLVQVAG